VLVWLAKLPREHEDLGVGELGPPVAVAAARTMLDLTTLSSATAVSSSAADGETVIEALTLPPLEAVDYLAGFDDGQLTEVSRLAIAMGHVVETVMRVVA
jgi:hypothetical protein